MFPSHPLFRHFENELVVGEHKLEWTTPRDGFFFRPAGSDVRVVWCELGRPDVLGAVTEPFRVERIKKRIAQNIALKRQWRFWPFGEDSELVLCPDFTLMRYKGGALCLRLEWLCSIDADELMLTGELGPILSRLESSEEMWRFLGKVRSEGDLRWFECSRGDHDQLKRVLWACMKVWGCSFYASERSELLFRHLLHAPYNALKDRWEQFGRVGDLLDEHFALNWHPLASRVYNVRGQPLKRPSIAILPSPNSSQHEHLEARLVWREFLLGKVPSDEIEVLMGG